MYRFILIIVVVTSVVVGLKLASTAKFYFSHRYDLRFAYSAPPCNTITKDGHVIEIELDIDDLTDGLIESINKLNRLKTIIVRTYRPSFKNDTCLAKLGQFKTVTEFRFCYSIRKFSILEYAKIPGTVTTIVMEGLGSLNDEELLRLAKFSHVKEVLAYGEQITEEGVKRLREARPDMRVWWLGEPNPDRPKDLRPRYLEHFYEFTGE